MKAVLDRDGYRGVAEIKPAPFGSELIRARSLLSDVNIAYAWPRFSMGGPNSFWSLRYRRLNFETIDYGRISHYKLQWWNQQKPRVSNFKRGYLSDQKELRPPIENLGQAYPIFTSLHKDRAGINSERNCADLISGSPPNNTSINNRIHMIL